MTLLPFQCPTVTRAHDYRLHYQGLIIGKSKFFLFFFFFFPAPQPTVILLSTYQICTTDAVLESCKSSVTSIYFQGYECVRLAFHFFRDKISVFKPTAFSRQIFDSYIAKQHGCSSLETERHRINKPFIIERDQK